MHTTKSRRSTFLFFVQVHKSNTYTIVSCLYNSGIQYNNNSNSNNMHITLYTASYFVWVLSCDFRFLPCLDDCDFIWRSPPVGFAPLLTLSLDFVFVARKPCPPVLLSTEVCGGAARSEPLTWCWLKSRCATGWLGGSILECWDVLPSGEWALLLWRLGGRLDCVAWDLCKMKGQNNHFLDSWYFRWQWQRGKWKTLKCRNWSTETEGQGIVVSQEGARQIGGFFSHFSISVSLLLFPYFSIFYFSVRKSRGKA